MNSAQQLPHSLEAEQSLLSCAFIDGSDTTAMAVNAGVTPDTFYDSNNGIIFAALCRLFETGRPIAVHIVAELLKDSRDFDRVGGYPFLTKVSATMPTTAQASFFIQRVLELATLRQLIGRSTAIARQARDWEGGDINALVEHAATSISEASRARDTLPSWPETLLAVQKRIDQLTDPESEQNADEISFGFFDLDHRFQRMQGGQLVIIGARPSVGKSSLARMIAHYNASKARLPVIFASLEVMAPSLATNFAQSVTGISYHGLRDSHPADVASFRHAVGELNLPNLQVLAGSQVCIAAIRARAKLMRARGMPVRVIVVDYLQLLPEAEPTRGENRASAVGRASRALKQLAIEEDCVVIALSQLNRDSAKDGREPAMHDLRESGDIEQDADKIILLHRPAANPLTGHQQPENSLPCEVPSFLVNVIQAKGRDDGTAIVALNFRRAIARFEQISQTK
jgi:replicative DNA helicase